MNEPANPHQAGVTSEQQYPAGAQPAGRLPLRHPQRPACVCRRVGASESLGWGRPMVQGQSQESAKCGAGRGGARARQGRTSQPSSLSQVVRSGWTWREAPSSIRNAEVRPVAADEQSRARALHDAQGRGLGGEGEGGSALHERRAPFLQAPPGMM
jgi:hypothetical protein